MRKLTAPVALTLALLIGVTAFAAVAFTPAPAEALCFGITVYYSDATFTEVVGARGTGCCGEVINWGDTSPYSRCERLYCLDVICPW